MRAYVRTLFGLNRDIRLFLLAISFGGFAIFGVQGVLLNLYWLRLGYGTEFIGLLLGVGPLAWGLAALPAAAAGRRVGLRAVLIIGTLITALAMGLLLLVESLPAGWWSAWLFLWWIVYWLGTALFAVNTSPYIMNIASSEERGFAFSAQMAVLSLTAFAGSLVAGWLVSWLAGWLGVGPDDPAPYRYALWLVPIVFVVESYVLSRARPATIEEGGAYGPQAAVPWATFAFLSVVFVLLSTGEGAVRAFYNLYLNTELGISAAQIGVVMGVAQLLPVAAALATPVLLVRWGTGLTLSGLTLFGAACMLPLAAIPLLSAATAGYVGLMTAIAAAGGARNLFSQETVAPRWRGVSSALNSIGLALSAAITAALGGYLITVAGYSGLFYLCAGLTALAGLLVWGYARRHAPALTPAAPLTPDVQASAESDA
jgi:MFS family permease